MAAPNNTVPAQRIDRPERPNDEEMKAMLSVLQQTMTTHKQRSEELRVLIEGKRRAGSRQGSSGLPAVRARVAELHAQLQKLTAQRDQVVRQLDGSREARERAKASLKDMRSGSRFTRVTDIEAQIAELEERLASGELEGGEERRAREQVEALQRSRSRVEELKGELKAQASRLEDDAGFLAAQRASAASLEGEIAKVKEQEAAAKKELKALSAAEAKESAGLAAWVRERDECRAMNTVAYAKFKELRAELDATWAAYKEQQAAFRAQQEERRQRHEEYVGRKAARDARQERLRQGEGAGDEGRDRKSVV